ncbi:MAG TPA: 50S ribosomal protein L28, partial [Coprothermobacter sp.]|nr:50S ribosomal protein L28 [Coprothermobacter sp.]
MARVCSVCGKGTTFGHNVSHSNRRTNRRWVANLKR